MGVGLLVWFITFKWFIVSQVFGFFGLFFSFVLGRVYSAACGFSNILMNVKFKFKQYGIPSCFLFLIVVFFGFWFFGV